MDIGSLPVVQAASSGIAAAPRTAGGLMQRLGQSVAALEGAMAVTRLDDAAAPAPLSFEEAFSVYGGAQCLEELESLSNECARSVNRTRAQLAAEGGASERREALERLSAALPAVFDLQTVCTQGTGVVAYETPATSTNAIIVHSHMHRTRPRMSLTQRWQLATASSPSCGTAACSVPAAWTCTARSKCMHWQPRRQPRRRRVTRRLRPRSLRRRRHGDAHRCCRCSKTRRGGLPS